MLASVPFRTASASISKRLKGNEWSGGGPSVLVMHVYPPGALGSIDRSNWSVPLKMVVLHVICVSGPRHTYLDQLLVAKSMHTSPSECSPCFLPPFAKSCHPLSDAQKVLIGTGGAACPRRVVRANADMKCNMKECASVSPNVGTGIAELHVA